MENKPRNNELQIEVYPTEHQEDVGEEAEEVGSERSNEGRVGLVEREEVRDTSDEASVDEDEDQDGAEADEEVHGTEAGPEHLQDISRGRSHSHLHFSLSSFLT